MDALKELAVYAEQNRIRGRSYVPNSLLKPLDIILQELERCPNTHDRNEFELMRAGSKGLLFAHIHRIAKWVPEDKVYHYVDLFFNEVLIKAHHNNANRLLQRERLIRSAYLVYLREAIAKGFIARGKAKNTDDALQELQKSEAQETDLEETEEATF